MSTPELVAVGDVVGVTERGVSSREGLAVGTKGYALDVALFHGERILRQALARAHVPQHHAAVSGREGLAVGAEGNATDSTLTHTERVFGQALARGHVPQHHTAAEAHLDHMAAVDEGVPGGEG